MSNDTDFEFVTEVTRTVRYEVIIVNENYTKEKVAALISRMVYGGKQTYFDEDCVYDEVEGQPIHVATIYYMQEDESTDTVDVEYFEDVNGEEFPALD